MKLLIASDHGGFLLKKKLMEVVNEIQWKDLGCYDEASVDYPDYAQKLCEGIKADQQSPQGVLICKSGQGIAMTANRYPHIRAALCFNKTLAHLARQHNNANVLCLGSQFVSLKEAQTILTEFLKTPFEGGRHERRVKKMKKINIKGEDFLV